MGPRFAFIAGPTFLACVCLKAAAVPRPEADSQATDSAVVAVVSDVTTAYYGCREEAEFTRAVRNACDRFRHFSADQRSLVLRLLLDASAGMDPVSGHLLLATTIDASSLHDREVMRQLLANQLFAIVLEERRLYGLRTVDALRAEIAAEQARADAAVSASQPKDPTSVSEALRQNLRKWLEVPVVTPDAKKAVTLPGDRLKQISQFERDLSQLVTPIERARSIAELMMLASATDEIRLVTFCYALQVCSLAPADGQAGRAVLDYLDTQEREFRFDRVGRVIDKGERISRTRADILQNERLDSLEAEVLLLRKRVDNLQGELRALGQWVADLNVRVGTLEDQVRDLQSRVLALEQWRQTTETRLAKIEQDIREIRTDVAFLSSILQLPTPGDADGDGLDDRAERLLIESYAPVYKLNNDTGRPPCSITWFIRHCYLRGPTTLSRETLRNDPEALLHISTSGDNRLQFSSEAFRGGRSDVPGHLITWDSAIKSHNQGMYAHVVRGERAGEIVVQYFLFCTWNETAYSWGFGNHEGDWGCVDVHVRIPELITEPDASGRVILDEAKVKLAQRVLSDPTQKKDRVVGVRFHNHGRFIDARGDAIEVDGVTGHPTVYIEGGTNEAWPNAGPRGAGGWPGPFNGGRNNPQNEWTLPNPAVRMWTSRFGYWIWYDFDGGNPLHLDFWGKVATSVIPGQEISEHKICREHAGTWATYRTAGIPNLGEKGSPMTAEAKILFAYPGKWGGWWKVNASPESPPFNGKMWLDRDPGSRYDGPKEVLRLHMRR